MNARSECLLMTMVTVTVTVMMVVMVVMVVFGGVGDGVGGSCVSAGDCSSGGGNVYEACDAHALSL